MLLTRSPGCALRSPVASLLLGGATIAQGSTAILVRQIELPAAAIVCLRVALGAATLALLAVALRRCDLLRLPGKAPLGLGLLIAAQFTLYFAAIRETSVASAVMVTYAAPVFILILAPVILGERLTRVRVGATGVSLAGVALIAVASGTGQVRGLGVALAAGAALAFALLLVLFKRFAGGLDATTVVFWESVVAAVVLSPFALLASYAALDAGQVAAVLVLGVVLSGMVTVMFVTALRWVPATTGGVLTYLEPLSAALLAVLLLDEALTLPVVLGGVAIIVGAGTATLIADRTTARST